MVEIHELIIIEPWTLPYYIFGQFHSAAFSRAAHPYVETLQNTYGFSRNCPFESRDRSQHSQKMEIKKRLHFEVGSLLIHATCGWYGKTRD